MAIAFSINCIITGLISFVFGLLIIYRRTHAPKPRLVLLWSMVCFMVGFWSFGLGMMTSSSTLGLATFWIRVHYFGAILIPTIFLHYTLELLDKANEKFNLLVSCYFITLIFEILSAMSLLAFPIMKPPFRFYTAPGEFYNVYSLYFLLSVAYALFLLFKEFRLRKIEYLRRNQILYLFLGSGIGFLGGSTAFLPVYNIHVFPFGMYLVVAYVFTVGYSILKHRLMDITIIIRKTIIYSTVMTILTSVYLIIVAAFAHLFEGVTGYQTIFSSAMAAALITLGFQPLRKRIQSIVDTKFFRQYVDREQKLYELSREVITHTTPEEMAAALIRVLGDTIHPKFGALYLRTTTGASFKCISTSGSPDIPQEMPDDSALAIYFRDHPQPFALDSTGTLAEPRDTRSSSRDD